MYCDCCLVSMAVSGYGLAVSGAVVGKSCSKRATARGGAVFTHGVDVLK